MIFDELKSIATKGVSQRELDKAKNRVRAEFVFGLATNLARAQKLAEFETFFGDASLLTGELERYQSVSADDVKRVTGQYSRPPTARSWMSCRPRRPASRPQSKARRRPMSALSITLRNVGLCALLAACGGEATLPPAAQTTPAKVETQVVAAPPAAARQAPPTAGQPAISTSRPSRVRRRAVGSKSTRSRCMACRWCKSSS